MGKKFKHDWTGTVLKDGIRYLSKEIDFVGIEEFNTPPLEQARKISFWQRLRTAVGIWIEKLILKIRGGKIKW